MSVHHLPVRDGLFEEESDGGAALLGGRCRVDGRPFFPRAATCPYCASSDVEAVRLPSTGTLWAHTVVHTAPPGYDGPVPFGFGVVELDDGLRVITRLETVDVDGLRFGQPMRAVVIPLHDTDDGDTVVTYSFEAAS